MNEAISNKRQFCFWYVCTETGNVRKYQIATWKLRSVATLGIFLLLGSLYVAGDYSRIQALRAKGVKTLFQLTGENATLAERQQLLTKRLTALEASEAKISGYEREVREKLVELQDILQEATSLGIVNEQPLSAVAMGEGGHDHHHTHGDEDNMGGAELPCVLSITGGCINVTESEGVPITSESFSDAPAAFERASDNDRGVPLVEVLGSLIGYLKTLPLGFPAHGHVSSGYGPRRSPFSGRMTMHQGVDLSLPYGSEIVASGDGEVVSVAYSSTYGRKIDIKHRDGLITRYAHLSKALVRRGQKVCQGQRIGLVGSTGRSTGPHLHYEVRVNNKAINPDKLFTLANRLSRVMLS